MNTKKSNHINIENLKNKFKITSKTLPKNQLFCIMKGQMLFSRHALAMHDMLHLIIK